VATRWHRVALHALPWGDDRATGDNMTAPDHLPHEATDAGDRIVLAPDAGTRVWAVGSAVLAFVIAALLIVTGDGMVTVLAGVAVAIAGLYLLAVQAQRLEFDAETARRRSLLRPAQVAWSEVTEARIDERFERTHAAGPARRLGGLTLSMGPGGGRGTRGPRRDRPFVLLTLEHRAAGPDLTMELNRSDVPQAEALLTTLAERAWLPADVPVTVDAAR
jgi:hypothetical protein